MGADENNLDRIIKEAEEKEQDSNQILEFTKEVKNKNIDEKKIVIEALWNIIYSDENADIYETNLMRRLSGLLYLDPKIVGDIKEKIKSKQRHIWSMKNVLSVNIQHAWKYVLLIVFMRAKICL